MTLVILCSKVQNIFNKYFEYISLFIFFIISLFLYFRNYFSYIFLSIAAIIGLIIFIILSKYFNNNRLSELESDLLNQKPSFFIIISSIFFFISYSLSLLTLPDGFYSKTILYYLFVSICAGSIATEIIFVESKYIWKVNLFKSVLLFLNLSLSNQLVYPLGIGNPDNFYHVFNIVVPIIEQGRIPLGYTYTNFPIHHLLTSIVTLITSFSPSVTYNYLGSTVMSLGPMFAFLVGRKILDRRVGLLSALVYCCSDYLIYWGSHPVQLSFIYPMILLIFMIILYILKDRNSKFILLYLIMCINIVFLHHYSAMMLFFIMIPIMFIEFIKKTKQKKYITKSFSLSVIFIIMLLCQWIYYSNLFGGFIHIIVMYKNAFAFDISSNVVSQTYYDTMPIKTLFLNEIGSCILIAFSVIGFFYLLRNRFLFGYIIVALFVLLVGLIGIGAVINVYFLLPNRIYAFLQELSMVYLMSICIVWILNNKNSLKIWVVLLITILLFFSASSTIAGFETSPLVGDQAYWKIYETPFERNSLKWINESSSEKSSIFFNPSFVSSLQNKYEIWPIKETNGRISVDLDNITVHSYILFSNFDMNPGFRYGRISNYHMGYSSWIKMKPDVKDELNRNIQILRIYDNGMLSAYGK